MGLMLPQASDSIQELTVEELRAKVGTGMEILDAEEHMLLSMGPQHPSTHGVLRLLVELDGETVVNLAPDIGFLHTGIEKNMESKRYVQALVMTDRMDYLAPLVNNQAYTLAVEKLLDLEIPPRAEYLRVMISELNRLTSHLVWLGTSGLELGAITVFFYCYRERDAALDLFEMISGERMNNRYFQVGGCADDMPPGFEQRLRDFIGRMPARIDEYEELLTHNPIWLERTKGIGVLPPDELLGLGVTGPPLRAAGVPLDLRKAQPYSGYEHFQFDVATGRNGDAYDRYLVRVREMRESVKIIGQCLDGMPEGPHIADDRKVVPPPRAEMKRSMEALIHHFKLYTEGFHVPAGEVYAAVEAPKGEFGVYLVSDGTNKPYRCKIRAPGFAHLQAMDFLSRGHMLADVSAILGSLDIVFGECDR